MTTMRRFYGLLWLLAMLAGAASQAHADMKGTMVIGVDPAQLKAALHRVSAAQRAEVLADPMFESGGSRYTFYVSGDNSRVDTGVNGIGSLSILTTGEPPKTVMLVPALGRYKVLPPNYGNMPQNGPTHAQVIPTPDTKTLLGHIVHKYRLIVRENGVTLTGEIWAAPDLSALPPSMMSGPSFVQQVWRKVKGMTLEMIISLTVPVKVALTYRVTSLSTSSLPASVFATPPGYSPAAK